MEIILEILIGNIVVNYIGLRTRYLFWKLFGRDYTLQNLSGNKKRIEQSFTQNLLNGIVGLIISFFLALLIAWIVYS